MTVTASSFRADFPEFADIGRFPDSLLTRWLVIAPKFHNPDRWGELLDTGVGLYVAHRVALATLSAEQAAGGGMPGIGIGIIASQSASKISVSFDTSNTSEDGAGHWNITTYGMQWREIMRVVGAGPLEVDAGDSGASESAWAGPFV